MDETPEPQWAPVGEWTAARGCGQRDADSLVTAELRADRSEAQNWAASRSQDPFQAVQVVMDLEGRVKSVTLR